MKNKNKKSVKSASKKMSKSKKAIPDKSGYALRFDTQLKDTKSEA
jgi:hypothetical protein